MKSLLKFASTAAVSTVLIIVGIAVYGGVSQVAPASLALTLLVVIVLVLLLVISKYINRVTKG